MLLRKSRLKAKQKEKEKLLKDLQRFESTLSTLIRDKDAIESKDLTEEQRLIQYKLLDSSISRVEKSIKSIKKRLEVL